MSFLGHATRHFLLLVSLVSLLPSAAQAATTIPLTVTLSEAVTVTGSPRLAVDVGGTTRYATFTSGSGTNTLTFTYTTQAGDVDLDGIAVSSPLQLNGGTIKDTAGNDASLTFSPPNTSGIKVNYPSVGMDFVADADGRYTLNGTVYNDLPSFLSAAGGTFTRASVATYFDSTGVMQTATNNTPRFDYDPVTHLQKGLLIEESRTNSLRNGNAIGAVAGSPGALPTWWSLGGSGVGALVQQVVGTGMENGISYVDIRFSGTPSTTGFILYFEATTFVTAASGQNWQSTFYAKYSAGSLTNVSFSHAVWERASNGSALIGTTTPFVLTNTLTRYSLGRTLNNASTFYAVNAIQFNLTIGQPIDVTLRLGAPQLERGAFPTSYIPTTGSAAVTRAAETLSMPTSSWFNTATGAMYTQGSVPYLNNTSGRVFGALDDSTSSNVMHLRINDPASDKAGLGSMIGGVAVGADVGPVYVLNALSKLAFGYQTNNVNVAVNGLLGTNNTAISVPIFNRLRVGQSTISTPLSGWIEKLKYYPARVPDAQLQLMTQ